MPTKELNIFTPKNQRGELTYFAKPKWQCVELLTSSKKMKEVICLVCNQGTNSGCLSLHDKGAAKDKCTFFTLQFTHNIKLDSILR